MNICLKTSTTKIGGIMYRRTVVSIYSEGGVRRAPCRR